MMCRSFFSVKNVLAVPRKNFLYFFVQTLDKVPVICYDFNIKMISILIKENKKWKTKSTKES